MITDQLKLEKEISPELLRIQDFKGHYPKQLFSLAFTEMWERFCFYGNRALLTLFMVDTLGYSEADSNLKYGAIQAFVYAFTFVGGLLADKFLGFKKSLLWGGILMVLANTLLFINAKDFFYFGICLLILGTGFFKPNISTMVGELYSEGDKRRDSGFNLFYSGINIGAFLAGTICVAIANKYGYSYSFGAAALFMLVGLIVFLFTRKDLGPIGNMPLSGPNSKVKEYGVYIGGILILPLIYMMIKNTAYTDLFMYIIGPCTILYLIADLIMNKSSQQEVLRICAAMVFIIASVFFWAFFEQSGGSLNLFAKNNVSNQLLGFTIDPNIVNNSANALVIIFSSPFIGLFWLNLAKRKWDPNYMIKYALGFLFLGLAFYIFYSTRYTANGAGIASLNVFTLAYVVISIAELCISPIGLSLMTKLAPKRLWGVMMGLWFLASAYGQYLAGILGAGMTSPKEDATAMDKLISYTDGYHQLAIYAGVIGVLMIILSPLVNKLMKGNDV
jgi:POT family proton-dependent oligopeptide transporter